MAPPVSVSPPWRTGKTTVPARPVLLVLVVLNLGYFAWSYQASAAQSALLPPEVNPASILTMTPQEVQRVQSQAAANSAGRSNSASAMLLEYEDTPPKEIAPDR